MRRGTALAWLATGAFVATILAANAHLAYVAFASQPRCIDHLQTGEAASFGYAAAKSSC